MPVINWNSVPDYDEWGIDDFWSCNDWIIYHQKLAQHFGKSTAKEIWDYAFAQSTNLSSNLDCRSFNSSFISYIKRNNLNANTNLLTDVTGTTTEILSGALDTTSNVASGVFGTINSVFGGSNLKKTINIVLIVGGVLGVAYVYKAFKKQ